MSNTVHEIDNHIAGSGNLYQGVGVHDAILLLVKALKEQDKTIKELSKRIEGLEAVARGHSASYLSPVR